jgi:ribonuclease HII
LSFKATYRTAAYGGRSRSGRAGRTNPVPSMKYELALRAGGAELIGGVDEVGVGAWAGPVAVGVVVLKPGTRLYKVRDSKLVDPARRQWLAARVMERSLAWAVAFSWPEEIDRLGLSLAIKLAAERAIEGLACRPDAFLVDGQWNFLNWEPPPERRTSGSFISASPPCDSRTIVRGDSESVSIACASLIAKVRRDALMAMLSSMYPYYRFDLNKGYPSPFHKWALAAFGPSPVHRRLFAPVRKLAEEGTPGRLLPAP